MREIVYTDRGDGVFEPELTPAQKRKATIAAKKAQKRKEEFWDSVMLIAVMGISGGTILLVNVAVYAGWL